jgi:hypothetical protein
MQFKNVKFDTKYFLISLRILRELNSVYNKRYRIPKWQSKMNNSEKLATWSTQDEDKQNKNTPPLCVSKHK